MKPTWSWTKGTLPPSWPVEARVLPRAVTWFRFRTSTGRHWRRTSQWPWLRAIQWSRTPESWTLIQTQELSKEQLVAGRTSGFLNRTDFMKKCTSPSLTIELVLSIWKSLPSAFVFLPIQYDACGQHNATYHDGSNETRNELHRLLLFVCC